MKKFEVCFYHADGMQETIMEETDEARIAQRIRNVAKESGFMKIKDHQEKTVMVNLNRVNYIRIYEVTFDDI